MFNKVKMKVLKAVLVNELKGVQKTMNLKSKTVWSGVAMILYAVSAFTTGHMDANAAVEMIMEGFGLIFLRGAVGK